MTGNGTLIKGSTYCYVQGSSSNASVYTWKKDLTLYSSLVFCARCRGNSTNTVAFGIGNNTIYSGATPQKSFNVQVKASIGTTYATYTFDISSLKGMYYFGMAGFEDSYQIEVASVSLIV